MQNCKKCNKNLNLRNSIGYCQKHKHLSDKVKQQARESYHRNAEHKSEYGKVYCEANKEKIADRKKEYYKNNKEKINKRNQEYSKEHRKELNIKTAENNKLRYNTNPIFKLTTTCRVRIRDFLKLKGTKKTRVFNSYIGCSPEQLKAHIESQFLPGMSWENQGRGKNKWALDHIVPLSSASTEKRIYELSHYTNLQPLWDRDNIIKKDIQCPLIWKNKIIEANKCPVL